MLRECCVKCCVRLTSPLSKILDFYLPIYDNIILMGDFNSEVTEPSMTEFCNIYNLRNLVKEPTCYKYQLIPTPIDLILTNRYKCFQNTINVETGLSDFHKMTLIVLKTKYKKDRPKIMSYRHYKKFSNEYFISELIEDLNTIDINNVKYDVFDDIFLSLLDKHAPIKHKYIRANESLFMNKELQKCIMLRSL